MPAPSGAVLEKRTTSPPLWVRQLRFPTNSMIRRRHRRHRCYSFRSTSREHHRQQLCCWCYEGATKRWRRICHGRKNRAAATEKQGHILADDCHLPKLENIMVAGISINKKLLINGWIALCTRALSWIAYCVCLPRADTTTMQNSSSYLYEELNLSSPLFCQLLIDCWLIDWLDCIVFLTESLLILSSTYLGGGLVGSSKSIIRR